MVNLGTSVIIPSSLTGGFLTGTTLNTGQSIAGSNSYIESGQSTKDLINFNRQIEVETSISKTSLFAGQTALANNQTSIVNSLNQTNTSLSNFANEVTKAFQTVLNKDITIPGTANNTGTPSPSSKESESPAFTDSIKDGFAKISQTLGPIGIVAGIVLVGFLVLRK